MNFRGLCDLDQLLASEAPLFESLFSFSPVQDSQVLGALASYLSKSRGRSVDGIQLSHIKDHLAVVAPHLTHLFNCSFRSCSFPQIWKPAYIIPLNKCNPPSSESDTRPVANLAHLAKVFERIVANQLVPYLELNAIFDPLQSGFRSCHSTQSALLRVLDDARSAIDRKCITILVLFDFSKAFDTINYRLLLSKLIHYGLSADVVRWFHSYLSGRTQAVQDLAGGHSRFLNNFSGVPQGSVLGPILFLLFINDVSRVLLHSNHVIFADDLQIYLHAPPGDVLAAIADITRDAEAVSAWAAANGLRLNVTKTKAIILGTAPFLSQLRQLDLPPISVNDQDVPYVDSVRNLGVQISADLTWNRHVSQISRKVHATLHKLKHHREVLSPVVRTMLVNSLILPHLDYCCLVYNDASDYLNLKLQRLLNCSIRFIFNLRRDAHITPYRVRLRWLTVVDRRLFFLGCYLYQILATSSPAYLRACFLEPDPNLRRSSRLADSDLSVVFHLPSCRSASYRNSFLISAIYFWSSLSASLRDSSSAAVFRARLFDHLLAAESNHATGIPRPRL